MSKHMVLVTVEDLFFLLLRNKNRIATAGAICGFFALLCALLKPIEYEAEATFKDKGKTQTGLSKSISELIFLAADASESEALMMMKARKLYEELAKATGMQLAIQSAHRLFFIEKIKNNLLAEYAAYQKPPHPLLEEPELPFSAHSVAYSGETPLPLELIAASGNRYYLLDQRKNRIAEGRFGEQLAADAFTITLEKQEDKVLPQGSSYGLVLHPLGKTAEKISKKFRIEPDRTDKSFLKINYRHANRKEAAAHLELFMRLYQDYLRSEHQRLAALQVDYLQERQEEMDRRLKQAMRVHAEELSSDLSSTGFSTSEKALEFLATAQQNMRQKLLAITLELSRIERVQSKQELPFENSAASFVFAPHQEAVQQLAKEIRLLRQEAGVIERLYQASVELTLQTDRPVEEFQGINLATAKELLLHYTQELSLLEAQILQLRFTTEQIRDPQFEISSLSSVLNDPVSLEMITKASTLALSYKDRENRSQKELERISADLQVQRGFLIAHLDQNVSLLRIRENLLRKKLRNLHGVILERIREQIAVLEEQMDQFRRQNQEMLNQEKQLLEESLAGIRMEMASIPQKWIAETSMEHQLELNRSMIEEVAKLVESKNISNNLEFIQSAPIDLPLIPLHPVPPRLLLIAFLGIFTGIFLSCGFIAASSLLKGIKSSKINLTRAGFHVSGTLSQLGKGLDALRDTDLETLRTLINHVSSDAACTSLLLMQEGGPDPVWEAAGLLSKRGCKVLVIDLCLGRSQQEGAGLLQYLEGVEEWNEVIDRRSCADFLPAGGLTRFGIELLGSVRFSTLIRSLEQQYDWILAKSDAALDSAAAEALLAFFSRAAIIIRGETLNQLNLCLKQAGNPEKKISFLFLETCADDPKRSLAYPFTTEPLRAVSGV